MSVAQQSRRVFWARVDRIVKGCGRGMAVKKIAAFFDFPGLPPEHLDGARLNTARAILKRHRSNHRARPRKVVAGWAP